MCGWGWEVGVGGSGADSVCYLGHHPACGIRPQLPTQWGWSLFFPSTSHSCSFIHFVPTPTNIVTHWLNWSLSKSNLPINILAKLKFHLEHCMVILIQTCTGEEYAITSTIYITHTDLPTIWKFVLYAIKIYTSMH